MWTIVLHPKAARHQRQAAEVAAAAKVQVAYDPAAERCVAPGYTLPGKPYGDELLDVDQLAANPAARQRLINAVVQAHPAEATLVTPPHFLVSDENTASLNVALAADTRQHVDCPAIRATVLLNRNYGIKAAAELALQYAQAGVNSIELRITHSAASAKASPSSSRSSPSWTTSRTRVSR